MSIVPLVSLLLSGLSLANEEVAETCLTNRIKDDYATGWQVRSQITESVRPGEHRIYLLTLYAGNEYKFWACGDDDWTNIDLVLYNGNGEVVKTDETSDRNPVIGWTPTQTDSFYLAIHGTRRPEAPPKAGLSMAVTYK